MNTKLKRNLLIIFCFVINALLLSGCKEQYYVSDFEVFGYIDLNRNGEWDSWENDVMGFRINITMTSNNAEPKAQIQSLYIDLDSYKEMRDNLDFLAYNKFFLGVNASYSYSVSEIPDGLKVSSYKAVLVSVFEKEDEEYDLVSESYTLYVAFVPSEDPTPTPTATLTLTPTPTTTPTSTPLPTSTFTSTPTITAEITGYGSYGGGVDFVKFKITNKPPAGTFSAVVNGNAYSCPPVPAGEVTIVCQGPAFPSGSYVDVVLYYEGTKIFSGQILRMMPEEDKKPTEEIPQ